MQQQKRLQTDSGYVLIPTYLSFDLIGLIPALIKKARPRWRISKQTRLRRHFVIMPDRHCIERESIPRKEWKRISLKSTSSRTMGPRDPGKNLDSGTHHLRWAADFTVMDGKLLLLTLIVSISVSQRSQIHNLSAMAEQYRVQSRSVCPADTSYRSFEWPCDHRIID